MNPTGLDGRTVDQIVAQSGTEPPRNVEFPTLEERMLMDPFEQEFWNEMESLVRIGASQHSPSVQRLAAQRAEQNMRGRGGGKPNPEWQSRQRK